MKNILKTVALFFLFIFSFGLHAQTYKNPVISGDIADPSIIKIGNEYFASGTSSEWAPYYPVFKSDDLVNWKQTGHIFNIQPTWTMSSFWAPELYYHNNKIYCYYTARRKSDGISCIGVAVANSPTENFVDKGVLIDYGKEAIDAFVYDDNGQLYITWKAYGLDTRPIEIVGSKLSKDGLHLEGDVFSLLKDDERIGMEGQYIFKSGEYYYMIYSIRGCCGPGSDYQVACARSKKIEGPYEKYNRNPILTGGTDFLSCGHGTAVQTADNRTFYMCHAYLKGDGFYQGRQPILQEIKMNNEGWPYFVTGTEAKTEQISPFSSTVAIEKSDFIDNFSNDKLSNEWTWNYTHSDMQYVIKKGNLYLSGTPHEKNKQGTVLCVRPTSAKYTFETQVVVKNPSVKGLNIYGDDKNLIYLASVNNKVVLRLVKDGVEKDIFIKPYTQKNVWLKVDISNGRQCVFYWAIHRGKWNRINNDYIDGGDIIRWDRVARPGLIHIGENTAPAVFSSFLYKNVK